MNAPLDVSFFTRAAKPLTSYRKYWAARFGTAKFLPTSREEMQVLGWDSCDIIIVTGDAYVDHPSFGMAVIGRMLEAQGFSSYLLDQEDVETGLTLRQALRLVTAATAGKISGGGGATVTIRNAVADGVDRIVADVDSNGNRTAITYDLD